MSKPGAERKHDYDAVYRFIVDYKTEYHGESPSLRQIGAACNISSTSVIKYILEEMTSQGRIVYDGYLRHIHVVGATWTPPGEDHND